MYKVKKKVHSEAKPDWMVGVLYQIPPKVYDWQESYDACMKHLIIIKDILEKSSVKWHRGSRNLTQIRNVKVKGESLLVLTKAGRSTLSFRISNYSAPYRSNYSAPYRKLLVNKA
ncbi:hypothetical protein [Segatella sp.]|uniref:hypothetical protein n=1 Tax=Segatella sp. TaxID=2974253 RepID=UPI003AAE5A3D